MLSRLALVLSLGVVPFGCGQDRQDHGEPSTGGSGARGGTSGGDRNSQGGVAGGGKAGAAATAGGGDADAGMAGEGAAAAGGTAGSAGRGSSGGGTGGSDGGASGSDEGGSAGEDVADAGASGSADNATALIPGWSVRKIVRTERGKELVLEEVLQSFLEAAAGKTRMRELGVNLQDVHVWTAPEGSYISDFARHPSGDISAVLIADDRTLAIVRLGPDLSLRSTAALHDPDMADDPHHLVDVTDIVASGFPPDAARVGAVGETAAVAVLSSENSLILYRSSFDGLGWSAPARTLIEPATGLTPFLPIGGSFDTFNAITDWFRPALNVDEAGNVYVAIWAGQKRLPSHEDVFHDGLVPLPPDPAAPLLQHSDLLLTKTTPEGERLFSRVVGTEHEDEPYAIRAHGGFVAVVGRARRFPGQDNTIWDALFSVSTADGNLVGTRTIPLNASGILLAVDALPEGGWLLGGSDGWSQNPDGLSVLTNGTKLLLELPAFDAVPLRDGLPAGPRHNENPRRRRGARAALFRRPRRRSHHAHRRRRPEPDPLDRRAWLFVTVGAARRV